MSIRTAVPGPVKTLIRAGYVGIGTATASRRLRPDLLLVGGQRCGTTSLFRALEQHPQVIRPTLNKGINYFDLNYHRGESWYRGHFPRAQRAHRQVGAGKNLLAFEASGYYLFHPAAPDRIARDLPEVKIIAMLRDPIERAFSAWKHESARGFDNEPFERALELEAERTLGEADQMLVDPHYQSYSHRHHAYAARGDYVSQLRQFYDRFPHSQIHVVYSEDFFADPVREFRRLTDALGVDDVPGLHFDQHNARRSGPMPERAKHLLSKRFAGQVDQLTALVGRRPPWSGAGSESVSTT